MGELRRLRRSAHSNGKARGRDVTLTMDDMLALWGASGGVCALTGLEFDREPYAGKRRPFAVSLDRIDAAKGYTKDNCRLVCAAVNYAMSDWGLSVLRRVAVGLLTKQPEESMADARSLTGVVRRLYKGRTIYESTIKARGRRVYLGRFQTAWDAHFAYRQAMAQMSAGQKVLTRREKRKLHSNPIGGVDGAAETALTA